MKPVFLTLSQIAAIHRHQIARYGGAAGIRDVELFKSAAASSHAAVGGLYIHPSITEMAAAYMFHIVTSRPFIDGNKRVGAVSAITFLFLNERNYTASGNELHELVTGVANGEKCKSDVGVAMAAYTSHGQV